MRFGHFLVENIHSKIFLIVYIAKFSKNAIMLLYYSADSILPIIAGSGGAINPCRNLTKAGRC
jgi:hypothetical protein